MLLLSDGEPNSDDKRDACHAAAKAAQIPVFTVGLGPAAEGDMNVDPDAVKVLRELAHGHRRQLCVRERPLAARQPVPQHRHGARAW